MNAKQIMVASVFALGLIAGCKKHDQDANREPALPTETAPAKTPTGDLRQDTPPAEVIPPRAEAPQDTQRETATAKDRAKDPAKDPAQDRPAATAGKKPSYSAALSGEQTKGTATFTGEESGLTKVLIDVRGAPKGTYAVHLFDGRDCAALSEMETPFAGGPGKAGEGKVGSPGPATTMALWRMLGSLTVDESGAGKVEVELEGDTKLAQRMVVIYADAKPGAKPEKQNVIACGPVKTGEAGREGAG